MITQKFCPNCGSSEVEMVAGGTTGNWMCRECGYMGTVFEKEIFGKEMKNVSKSRKQSKVKIKGGKK